MNVDDHCIHRIRIFQNGSRNMADFGHHEIRGITPPEWIDPVY